MREDPGKDLKAAEDFFQLVWEGHVVSAAIAIVGERNEQRLTISKVAELIAARFAPPLFGNQPSDYDCDGVISNAKEVMILGFVYHGFYDAIREGEGDRIMVYWKLLLLAFKASNRRNYAKGLS